MKYIYYIGRVRGRGSRDKEVGVALGVLAGLEVTRDAADGELESGLGRPRHRLGRLRLAVDGDASGGIHRRFVFGGGSDAVGDDEGEDDEDVARAAPPAR